MRSTDAPGECRLPTIRVNFWSQQLAVAAGGICMTQDLHALLAAYEATLVADDDCRDVVNAAVKNVTAVQRRLGSTVQMAHQISDPDDIADLCARGRQTMAGLPELWADIHNKLNGRHPEAFRYMWRHQVANLVTAASFIQYLENGTLLTKANADICIGVASTPFAEIDLEDYLLGLCGLPSELARFCLNLVTTGDTESPVKVRAFVSELYSAFQVLNLRNDLLRKRFDSIKYDLQKLEGIVYDISIRKDRAGRDRAT
ncbi:Translin [Plasmodiophora brassicae]|nr:hypothetical protein PBRA_000611 [Plasmodiophora brassicae]